MRNIFLAGLTSIALLGLASPGAYAQRGVGDSTGVASRAVKPKIVSLSGKLIEIRTGLCESSTGQSPVGTHIVLKTSDGKQLNVHLGPAAAVEDKVATLTVGDEVSVKAFRTDKMKTGDYAAQSITAGDNRIELRDAGLRPVWAGANAGPRGSGAAFRGGCGCCGGCGRGMGYGRGMGNGRGMGCGQCGMGWRGGR